MSICCECAAVKASGSYSSVSSLTIDYLVLLDYPNLVVFASNLEERSVCGLCTFWQLCAVELVHLCFLHVIIW